jgi:type IV pilus biogenesis protein PilP
MKQSHFKWGRFAIAFAIAAGLVIVVSKAMSTDIPKPLKHHAAAIHATSPAVATSVAAPSIADVSSKSTTKDSQSASPEQNTTAASVSGYKMPNWESYYGTADAIRADSELATAELENLKIHHQLDEARKGNFQTDAASNQPGLGMSQMSMPAMPTLPTTTQGTDNVHRSAVVDQTSMVDNQWVASIQLPSGVFVPNVHQGQDLPGVGRVTNIALTQVLVLSGGRTIALPFATDSSVDQDSTSSASLMRPMPTMPSPIVLH